MGGKAAILDAITTLECLLCDLRLPVDNEICVALHTVNCTLTALLEDNSKFLEEPSKEKAVGKHVSELLIEEGHEKGDDELALPVNELELTLEPESKEDGTQLYQCPYCDAAMKSEYILEIHISKHIDELTKEKTRPMDTLSESVDRKDTIPKIDAVVSLASENEADTSTSSKISHVKSSLDPQLYFKCNYCSFETYFLQAMENHARNELKSRPFKCDTCDYKVKRLESLRIHLKRVHDRVNTLYCGKCSFETVSPKKLQEHYDETVHGVTTEVLLSLADLMETDISAAENITAALVPVLKTNKTPTENHDAPSTSWVAACQNEFMLNPESDKLPQLNSNLRYSCNACSFATNKLSAMEEHAKGQCDKSRPFQCDICDYTAKRLESLRSHRRRIHEGSSVKCTKCDFSAPSKEDLKSHMESYHPKGTEKASAQDADGVGFDSELFQSEISDPDSEERYTPFEAESDDYSDLDSGEEYSPSKDPDLKRRKIRQSLKCRTCGFKADSHSGLRDHRLSHPEEMRYQCDICDYKVTTKESLDCHYRKHSGNKLLCDECGFETVYRTSFKLHKKAAHMNYRPFKCKLCDYCGKQNESLKKHMRKHTGERPFKCPQCESTFKYQGHVSRHMLIHTGVKPYSCELCPYRANQKIFIKVHMRTHRKDNHNGLDS